jgi:hypothetical protein
VGVCVGRKMEQFVMVLRMLEYSIKEYVYILCTFLTMYAGDIFADASVSFSPRMFLMNFSALH